MLGNSYIAEILTKEYGILNLEKFEKIDYTIENFNEKVSKVTITSNGCESFCCPVYAMFDGNNMSWYGDYGFWGFNCTWDTNIHNLNYSGPYYMLEKLVSKDRYEFNAKECEKQFLELLKEGSWYNTELDEAGQKRFLEFIEDPFDYISCDGPLYEYENLCETLRCLYRATGDKYDWISSIRNLSQEDISDVFNCEEYALYDIGNKPPARFFIILYLLSIVAERETAKNA